MAHICRLAVKNLGPYVAVDVPLGPGLTAIVGENLAGKTWLQRAVRWALLNDGRDYESLCHEPGEPVEAMVWFDTGLQILRRRAGKQGADGHWTTSKNELVVTQPDGQVLNLSPGTGPNATVMDLTGIGPQTLAKDWQTVLQFQDAKDPDFLLAESPGRQESALARVMGVDVLEAASDIVGQRLTSKTRGKNEVAQDAKDLEQQLLPFEALDQAAAHVESAEQLGHWIGEHQAALEREGQWFTDWQHLRAWLQNNVQVLEHVVLPDGSELTRQLHVFADESNFVESWAAAQPALGALRRHIEVRLPEPLVGAPDLEAAAAYVLASAGLRERQRQAVDCAEYLNAADAGVTYLGGLVARLQLGADYAVLQQALTEAHDDVTAAETALVAAGTAYNDALVRLGRCPTCKQSTAALATREV